MCVCVYLSAYEKWMSESNDDVLLAVESHRGEGVVMLVVLWAVGATGVGVTLYDTNDQDRLLKALCDRANSSHGNTGDLRRKKVNTLALPSVPLFLIVLYSVCGSLAAIRLRALTL